jgi:hypothetical protein
MYVAMKKSMLRAFAFAALASLMTILNAGSSRAQWATNGSNISNTNAGNVGIGTTTPSTAKLVISGVAGANGLDLSSTDQYAELRVIRNSLNAGDKDLYLQWQAGAGSKTRLYSNNIETMTLNAGNVGIGTGAPIRGLQLSGANYTTAAEFAIANTGMPAAHRNFSFWGDSAAGSAGRWYIRSLNDTGTASGRDFLTFDNASGSVGIGNARGDSLYNYRLVIADNTAGSGVSNFLNISNYIDADINFKVTQVGATAKYALISPSPANVPLALSTNAGGRVGIGTTAPASALHVVGDITVTGNINAKYQDVAEWVPSTEKLAAGTVVVLDGARDNHVMASAKSYDTRVAGVVSAQPGLTLGEAGEGKALVATTGRVKVKVDASRGAIHVGDLLVTSDVPGVAMLSKPLDLGGVPIHRPGTLIGKALGSLEQGTGEILVLLSLQ